MNMNRITIRKSTAYSPVEIEIVTLPELARRFDWTCELYPNGEMFERRLIQGNPPYVVLPLARNVIRMQDSPFIYMRTLDEKGETIEIVCSSLKFDEEAVARIFLQRYSILFKDFETPEELLKFAEGYAGIQQVELRSTVLEWYEKRMWKLREV